MRYCGIVVLVLLAGCSSSTPSKSGTPTTQIQPPQRVAPSSNPVAKYIELSGFRIGEKAGKLEVKFAVTNHSDADVGNIVMNVSLRPTTAKASDPPLATFTAKVDGLGPEELKEVTADIPTKLRAYELPDWQFLTYDFQIIEPK
ncbi:MAG TPA: hypothetical protein VFW44_18130 [Bryobacteraceae bacterium]|nr:hypothetical protein [Bryobacteraceae bacterium]